eukprot:6211931-Pleurochrysis_carterae.AAC.2
MHTTLACSSAICFFKTAISSRACCSLPSKTVREVRLLELLRERFSAPAAPVGLSVAAGAAESVIPGSGILGSASMGRAVCWCGCTGGGVCGCGSGGGGGGGGGGAEVGICRSSTACSSASYVRQQKNVFGS